MNSNSIVTTKLQQKEKGPQIEPLKTLSLLVGVERFELPTPCSQSRCANRTALYPDFELQM